MSDKDRNPTDDSIMSANVTRREFIRCTAGTVTCISLGAFSFGCSGNGATNVNAGAFSVSNGENLRFVFLADSRGGDLDSPVNETVLKAIIAQISTLSPKPAFVIFGGDMSYRGYIEHKNTKGYTFQAWKDLFAPLKLAGIPLFTAIGNHELYRHTATNSTTGFHLANQQEYQKVFTDNPVNGPPGYERLVYSFSSPGEDIFFAVLDPYYLTADTIAPSLGGTIDDTQLKWLTAQIAKSNATHKFLFIHTPYYYVSDDPNEPSTANNSFTKLWTLLDDNRFNFYACGHSHLFSRKTIDSSIPPQHQLGAQVTNWQNNVVQLLNGTCGAGVESTVFTPEHRAQWHIANDADTYYFSVADVSGDLLTVNSYKGNTGVYEIFDRFSVTKDRFGAYEHDNIVQFNRYPSISTITYTGNGQHSITSGQPWGGLNISESEGNCSINARAGRKGSSSPAEWLKSRTTVAISISGSWGAWPHELNFAFEGTVVIDGNSYQVVLGQGNDGAHNNWWIGGGTGFTSDQLSLITPDKKYRIRQDDVSFNEFYVEPGSR